MVLYQPSAFLSHLASLHLHKIEPTLGLDQIEKPHNDPPNFSLRFTKVITPTKLYIMITRFQVVQDIYAVS